MTLISYRLVRYEISLFHKFFLSIMTILQTPMSAYAGGPVPGSPGNDPYINYVSLLLHGEGANNSKTIIDSSPLNKTITVDTGTYISTTKKKFGNSSIYSGASGTFGPVDLSTGFNFGTGDFTIEFYINNGTTGSYQTLFNLIYGGKYMQIRYGDSGFGYRLQISMNAGSLGDIYAFEVTSSGMANTWHHMAWVRKNGVHKFFIDGVQQSFRNGNFSGPLVSSFTDTSNVGIPTTCEFGAGAYPVYGYFDDCRITKGVARYDADFSVPTEAF